jgi:hypothetical protein
VRHLPGDFGADFSVDFASHSTGKRVLDFWPGKGNLVQSSCRRIETSQDVTYFENGVLAQNVN